VAGRVDSKRLATTLTTLGDTTQANQYRFQAELLSHELKAAATQL